ncbi:MAG: RNA polymerase sigma factor [Saprospiraceae bacterium]|nr:RNA polymerase sigma factor [Saprospiraceae bacterium]
MLSFSDLYEAHQHMVYNLCLHYLQNRQDAEEAAQDIFVKIHRKLPGFQEKSSLKTWIYRIAVHHCLDVLKARTRHKRFAFFKTLFSSDTETPAPLTNFDHPGVQLEDREALELLFQKINQLPEQQKTALILKYLDELPQRDIAAIMGLSEKAVESLLQRAKQGLKKK